MALDRFQDEGNLRDVAMVYYNQNPRTLYRSEVYARQYIIRSVCIVVFILNTNVKDISYIRPLTWFKQICQIFFIFKWISGLENKTYYHFGLTLIFPWWLNFIKNHRNFPDPFKQRIINKLFFFPSSSWHITKSFFFLLKNDDDANKSIEKIAGKDNWNLCNGLKK